MRVSDLIVQFTTCVTFVLSLASVLTAAKSSSNLEDGRIIIKTAPYFRGTGEVGGNDFSNVITKNNIPTITPIPSKSYHHKIGRKLSTKSLNSVLDQNSLSDEDNIYGPHSDRTLRHLKKKRLLRFLWNFRLDFTKFDTSCLKREGRGLMAPNVPHARVTKYTIRRNQIRPSNHYAMSMYECEKGFEFPQESSDRMFCSKNKWVGPTPVCLPKSILADESQCGKCDQICTAEENIKGRVIGVRCSCYAGYEMLSNGTCGDIDECSVDNGGCSEICFNQPGSFQCSCPSGYRVGPDGTTCIDRNECLLRNGHGPCQDTCENTPGSYICSCVNINGTRLSSDKHSCEDINECEERDNFGCTHVCLNTFGNAFCTCPKGLTLSTGDYKTCLGEEIAENYITSEVPKLTTPLPIDCPPGSAQSFDVGSPPICIEYEDCTLQNGGCDHDCISTGSARFCSCREGYELLNETACADVDECQWGNGGCDQECVNTQGSFHCACRNGYRFSDHSQTSCQVTFCEPPPIEWHTVGWDCEHPRFVPFVNDNKPRVGTRCKLRCTPGYSLTAIQHDMTLKEVFGEGPSFPDEEEDNNIFSTAVAEKWITCSEDGTWKGLKITAGFVCVLTSCTRLTTPKHGTIYPEEICLHDHVPLDSQCLLVCDAGYYPKNGKIRTCSTGYNWFPEDNPVCIKLPPTPPPYIYCPSDIQIDLKPGHNSAYVKIPQPQANMDWYRYVEADPPWAKNLEGEASPGTTQVSFIARTPLSNETATCDFKIHVVDREAPRVHGCPTSFEIRLSSREGSREVWWAEPKFSDNVHVKYVQQSHSPGLLLSRGNHHIIYVAGDAEGNKARCSFTVTVHGSKDYENTDHHHPTSITAVGSGPTTSSYHNIMIICPNLKTGRWIVHYAFYLPPGCRYSPPPPGHHYYTTYAKLLNNYDKNRHSAQNPSQLRQKTLPRYIK